MAALEPYILDPSVQDIAVKGCDRTVVWYADGREATLVLCAVGRGDIGAPHISEVLPIAHATEPSSATEVTFPEIPRMHAAAQLRNGAEAAA